MSNAWQFEINRSIDIRHYKVAEFAGFDGSLPEDLKGKSPEEIAYTSSSPRAATCRGIVISGQPPKIGEEFSAGGLTFICIEYSHAEFRGIEKTV
jgi:hypothetical protein